MIRTTDYFWNPALAGHPGEWGAHANYQQSWLGFEGAPITALVGGTMNWKKKNMALAGDILFDQTGPLRFTGLSVAYKYQLNPGFLDDDDRISFGILGTLGQRGMMPLRPRSVIRLIHCSLEKLEVNLILMLVQVSFTGRLPMTTWMKVTFLWVWLRHN